MVLAWRCRQWQTLPAAGGLFDQPLAVMNQMEQALYVAETFRERAEAAKNNRLVQWAEQNPEKLSYCRQVEASNDSELENDRPG